MFADWVHFVALYLITVALLRIAQERFKDSAWGPTLAFFG